MPDFAARQHRRPVTASYAAIGKSDPPTRQKKSAGDARSRPRMIRCPQRHRKAIACHFCVTAARIGTLYETTRLRMASSFEAAAIGASRMPRLEVEINAQKLQGPAASRLGDGE
jgi:hypothetical protein